MSRFIMTLDEAVELVLFAFSYGKNGDIFVKKSPSAYIIDILESIKQIIGKDNIKKRVIGIRHSEKMYETLLSEEEANKCEELDQFLEYLWTIEI